MDHSSGIQQIIINEDGEEFSIDVDPCPEEYDMDETSPDESEKTQTSAAGSLSFKQKFLKKSSMSTVMTPSKPVSSAKALLDGKFFSVVAEFYGESRNHRKIRKIKAKCSLCPKPSYITCSYDSTSNFLRHIKLKHGKHIYESYLAYKKNKALNSNSFTPIQFVQTEPTNTQPARILEIPSLDKVQKLVDRFQMKLLNFMINAMQPLSLVDNPHFRDLFPEVLTPTVSGTVVGSKIEDLFNICQVKIKNILGNARYICFAVDIWTEKMCSLVGFTSHWMTDNFEKQSAVLACNRLTEISLDSFVNRMNEVFNTYNLKKEQIVAIVTENTYNYVKVLEELKLKCFSANSGRKHSLTYTNLSNDEDIYEADTLNVKFHSLDIETEFESTFVSMKNINHILNMFAIVDYKSLLDKYDVISKIHEPTIRKCNFLWNLISKQLISKEKISQAIGNQLSLPAEMSWKPFYNALKAVVEARDKLPDLYQDRDTENFSSEEIEYLHTYVRVMNPLAAAMETLEGESVYFGYVLPTLLTVKMKLEEMSRDEDSYMSIIVNHMLLAFKVRFQRYLSLDMSDNCVQQAILAAVSHPKLKLRWIPDNEKRNEITDMFVDECSNLTEESESHIDDVEDDEFFAACLQSKDVATTKNEVKYSSELEVIRFVASKDKHMDMLHSYPSVKLVFLKYNSLLTSSLPVEKLFTFQSVEHRDSSARGTELQAYLFLKGNSPLVS